MDPVDTIQEREGIKLTGKLHMVDDISSSIEFLEEV